VNFFLAFRLAERPGLPTMRPQFESLCCQSLEWPRQIDKTAD
jgi:hypothetical protein